MSGHGAFSALISASVVDSDFMFSVLVGDSVKIEQGGAGNGGERLKLDRSLETAVPDLDRFASLLDSLDSGGEFRPILLIVRVEIDTRLLKDFAASCGDFGDDSGLASGECDCALTSAAKVDELFDGFCCHSLG